MNHIEFDMLYDLANKLDNMLSFNDEENKAVQHIMDCKECYKKMCLLMALTEAANDDGFLTLSMSKGESKVGLSDKIMAIVNVTLQKIDGKISSAINQIRQSQDIFTFEAPFALSTRGGKQNSSQISIVKDIENEKTFICYNQEMNLLSVQVDTTELTTDEITVLLVLNDKEEIELPMVKNVNIYRGEIQNLAFDSLRVIIKI